MLLESQEHFLLMFPTTAINFIMFFILSREKMGISKREEINEEACSLRQWTESLPLWFPIIPSSWYFHSFYTLYLNPGLLGGTSGNESIYQWRRYKKHGFNPESGRSPGEGNGNLLQYSCLENPMDRGAWWAIIHGVTKSWTWLKWLSMHTSWILAKFTSKE